MATRFYRVPETRRIETQRFRGDCLENAGFPVSGRATIDRNAPIRIGDIVWCTRHCGTINTYLKKVRRIDADAVTVGTCYADPSRDFDFTAAEIFGVVLRATDDGGVVRWERKAACG